MGLQHSGITRAMKAALHVLYPPQCLGCSDPVASDAADVHLCATCWGEARFITGAACRCCAAPLPGDGMGADDSLICDGCLTTPPPWQHGRAAFVYSGTGRRLVLALKHGDRPDLVPPLARWLAQAVAPLILPDTIVAPVPLHLRRLLKRKYNQAALLSARVAQSYGVTHQADLLIRRRHTPAQDHRSVRDRFANQDGALMVNTRRLDQLRDRPVLLIDDVMASGATLTAAARALNIAGAGPVSVAVLARAVKDD
ncbi:ComF family protein [Paracoccus sp. (in: a-proteobacteria)]|uniref:ComF family protein n=1 Tax=Paracoccus sp. TaxID=267 RepID=UPI0026DFDC48|nr:ComF family protein [Paracoccus sp. (in: a-proteobacteria)]MDO5648743.1 ComF family protein [Paracoccus sp. (in: a-proteobacteria)]